MEQKSKPPVVQKFKPDITRQIEISLRSTPEIEARREKAARTENNKTARFTAVIAGMVVIAAGTVFHMSKDPALNYGTPDQTSSIKEAQSDEKAGKFSDAAHIYEKLATTAQRDIDGATIRGKLDEAERSKLDYKYFKERQQADEQK